MKKYCLVLCTINSKKMGEKLANQLVKNHFAACVNLIPRVTSIYFWNYKLCKDNEILMIIKTKKSLFKKIKSEIKKNHPYSVPEIICLDIKDGSESYLNWLESVCRGS